MKFKLIIALLLFQLGFSQETKMSIKDYINFSYLPPKTSNTPSWANQFYDNPDQINVDKLKSDVNDWVLTQKKEQKVDEKKQNEKENELKESISENPIVQFAINFVNKVPNSWINEAGFIETPTKDAFFKKAEDQEKNNANSIKNKFNKNVLVNSWSQIGSKEIKQKDVQRTQSTCIYFISVAPSSTNIRMASSQAGMLYKTTDGGANWSIVSENPGPSAFHPTNPNKIMLGSNPLRISSDGGVTWTVKPVVAECNKVLWSNNGSTIIIATNSGIYVSSDAGSTFTLKQAGPIMDIEFKPGSSTIAYAINNAGIFYKTTDGGLNWVVKPVNYSVNNAGNTNIDGYVLAVTEANPDLVCIASLTVTDFAFGNKAELIKSTNSGENFALLSVTDIGYSIGYGAFVCAISPINQNTYYLGACSLNKSTNGGLNYAAIGGYVGPFQVHPDIQDIVLFGDTVVLATDGGVSESSDGFESFSNWKSTCKGLVGLDYWGFDIGFNTDQMGGGKYHNGNSMYNPDWNNGMALHFDGGEDPDGKAIFSRPNSMFFSKQGKNFKQVDVTYNPNFAITHPFTMENNVYYFGDRISDTNSNTHFSNIIYAGYENNVNVSYDNGATKQVLKSFNSKVWDVKTTRKDSKVLYVMTQSDGLWKTNDGGVSNWTLCNGTVNGVNLTSSGFYCYVDVSQTNSNEIWLLYRNSSSVAKICKSLDGGQTWISLNTPTLNNFLGRQLVHQYGSNGGAYILGTINDVPKCFYKNNTITDWVDYSSELSVNTLASRVFLKATYHKEKLRVASCVGVQEIAFFEKSNPVAQPTTNIKNICVNQEIKFCDYSILNYTGATWLWSFSKTPIYLNGTNAGSRDPIVKFLSPGVVNVTLKVTNSVGQSDTKTITDFITVNYDTASCLLLNSDNDYAVNCVNNLPNPPSINTGQQGVITNFNGATTGKFIIKMKLFNSCKSVTADFSAIVNLDTNLISTIRYSHFEDGVLPVSVTGDNTSSVTSFSNRYAQISFTLINKVLYLNHVSNFCSSIGEGVKTVDISELCWQPFTSSGISSGDFAELQKCNNQIPQSAAVTNNSDILVTDFANAISGLFYVNLNAFTSCNNATNNLKAIVNLDSDTIHVLGYQHFASTNSDITGNETSSITSTLTTNAQVNYFISNNKLYVKRIFNPCGNGNFRLNPSCWSAMDDDQNGIDNTLQPSNCNNTISGNVITNSNANLIQDFSPFAPTQKGVFVTLNIGTSCNNTTATAYLNVDLDNNLIHVINYKHFGSATFSTVLNNDSPNVYSESDANGKLKFSLINDKLYIQRVSTPCAGSNYQVTNSCYSLGSDQVLAIENFISNNAPTIIAYPNPTTSSFSIDTKSSNLDFSLNIYDINGKFITSKFEKTNDNLLQVDLTQSTAGIYFVVLLDKSNNKYNYLKIIKK